MFTRLGLFNANYACPLCNRLHAIRQCTRFMVMTPEQKLRAVAHHGLCSNCLAQSHQRPRCDSPVCCRICEQDHNSWLCELPEGKIWFSMTAQVRLITWPKRRPQETRVLLDPNAARSSMSSAESRRLHCVVFDRRTTVTIFHRLFEMRKIEVQCVIEDNPYGYNPVANIDRERHRSRSTDADDWWFERGQYFMILGADVAKSVLIGPAYGQPGRIYSQDTVFGRTHFGAGKVVPRGAR